MSNDADKDNAKWQVSSNSIYRSIKRETFTVGSTCLIVEDRMYRFMPGRNERILRLAGTSIYYSVAPLSPDQHRLLCYNYCEDALKLEEPDFYRHALVMGCGGGAIPRWLLEEYPSIEVDVVDYSSEMIRVCKEYFLQKWEDSPRLKFYCTDAKEYEPPAYQYQFLFCDLFDGTELAPFVYTKPFAEKLHRMLGSEGTLVINCGWGHLTEIMRIYQAEFQHAKVVDRKSWQTEVIMASDSSLIRREKRV